MSDADASWMHRRGKSGHVLSTHLLLPCSQLARLLLAAMESYLGSFQLEPTSSGSSSGSPLSPASPTFSDFSASSSTSCFFTTPVFRASTPPGSFDADSNSNEFNLGWDTIREFDVWFANEQLAKCFDFCLVQTLTGLPQFEKKLRYICSRHGTGGIKEYTKQFPERERKIPGKHTSCQCALVVKHYPNTHRILGKYSATHNHPLSQENLPFTRIPKATREFIAGHLRDRMSADAVVRKLPSSFQTD
jgi:hypothetical protein